MNSIMQKYIYINRLFSVWISSHLRVEILRIVSHPESFFLILLVIFARNTLYKND